MDLLVFLISSSVLFIPSSNWNVQSLLIPSSSTFIVSGSAPIFSTTSSGVVPVSIFPVLRLWLTAPFVHITSSKLGGCVFLHLFGSYLLFRIAVEEQIDHDIPVLGSWVVLWISQSQHLSGEEPPHQTDTVLSLVVARNSNINVIQRRVTVAKGNGWDVHVGSFLQWLMIHLWDSDDQDSWFQKVVSNLIRECSWGESSGNGFRSSVLSKLQSSSLSPRLNTQSTDILWVLNACNDTSSKHQLVPCLLQIEDVNTISATLPLVGFHGNVVVARTNVRLAGQHLSDVILSSFQNVRELAHCGIKMKLMKRPVYPNQLLDFPH